MQAAVARSSDAQASVARRTPCDTLRPMSNLPARWTSAAVRTPPSQRLPRIVALPAGGLPDMATLFTFMRDAELRFRTLRMRVEERTWGATGETLLVHEIAIRHPDRVRVTVRHADLPMPRDHETWVFASGVITTWSAIHGTRTERPARRGIVGLESTTLPASSKVYQPLTPLPIDSIAEVSIHPANYLQNVVSSGVVSVIGQERIAGREAYVVESLRPRTTRMAADRGDASIRIAADAGLGVISLLEQRLGDRVVRRAEAVSIEPDADIPDAAFDVAIPSTARRIY
jgi:hypothetical protein